MTNKELTRGLTGRMEELSRLGFHRIGKSSLYRQGPAIVDVHNDGSFDVLHDYDDGMSWPDIVGIKLGKASGEFSLVTLSKDGAAIERTINGSGGGMLGAKPPTRAEFQGKNIEQQLREANFTRDDRDQHVYRQKIKVNDQEVEIVALVQNGKIEKIYKPLNHFFRTKFTPLTQILECKSTKDSYGSYMISTYTLRDNTMQYQISDKFDGWLIEGSQKLIRKVTPESLGIEKFKVITEASGFKIGGINDEKTIMRLNELAGQTIPQLEGRMRPNGDSMEGFLGPDESLLEVLASDNNFVRKNGLTHQELAFPLLYAREHLFHGFGPDFQFNGINFHMEMIGTIGPQLSPFEDETASNYEMTIINTVTHDKLSCSTLLPDMILRYGFYEGKQTPYRLEPGIIMKVFGFKRKF